MSDFNPLKIPERAAHELVIELIRAGRIVDAEQVNNSFTNIMNHYNSELERIRNLARSKD